MSIALASVCLCCGVSIGRATCFMVVYDVVTRCFEEVSVLFARLGHDALCVCLLSSKICRFSSMLQSTVDLEEC